MTPKRLNVLVYAGDGASLESVKHCLYSLRRLLSPNYAVTTVAGATLINEPWTATCALLVMPGGADLGYCRTLNGQGNRRIRQYVNEGGAYLGLCAGGYYGTKKCEFEVGDPLLEVVGDRELSLFPGTSRGAAFKGFVYGSEAGARAAELKVNKTSFLSGGNLPQLFRCYFNGGSCFINDKDANASAITVLAEYTEPLDVRWEGKAAAVIHCKVGEGAALLTGPHPEFAAINLSRKAKGMDPRVVDDLEKDDEHRGNFFKACLRELGLEVNERDQGLPSLSQIHITFAARRDVSGLLRGIEKTRTLIDNECYIKGEADTFHIQHEPSSNWSMKTMTKAALDVLSGSLLLSEELTLPETEPDRIMDYNEIVKEVVIHGCDLPGSKVTPYFNHRAYYSNLEAYNKSLGNRLENDDFGSCLLYGEVVTSTSTLLEKNPKLAEILPQGSTMIATTQLSGRGRGSNVWISPAGSLMFSTIIRHPLTLNVQAPVVFIQYLAALAIIEGIQDYDDAEASSQLIDNDYSALGAAFTSLQPAKATMSSYRKVPVKLKWPNDVYALDPAKPNADPTDRNAYVKIGGILVNSSYSGGDYNLVLGIGLNVSNAAPTTSLNDLVSHVNDKFGANLEFFSLEKLSARILSSFGAIYTTFKRQGFGRDLERLYYKHWLHQDQIVTIETEGGAKAKILGITRDWGLLSAEEIDGGRATGKKFALQSDSNSFDFFHGLLKRKL